jgi:hypothetical protein
VSGFDEWRAARKPGGPRSIDFAGKTWTLPAELPWAVSDFLGSSTRGTLHDAVEALFGDQLADFAAVGLTELEAVELMSIYVPKVYDTSAPNSGGSTGSSETTGEPAPPTSDGSTGKTSAKKSKGTQQS